MYSMSWESLYKLYFKVTSCATGIYYSPILLNDSSTSFSWEKSGEKRANAGFESHSTVANVTIVVSWFKYIGTNWTYFRLLLFVRRYTNCLLCVNIKVVNMKTFLIIEKTLKYTKHTNMLKNILSSSFRFFLVHNNTIWALLYFKSLLIAIITLIISQSITAHCIL